MQNQQYSENELEASLRRAFVDGKADFIAVDGQTMTNPFLLESLLHGTEKGLLKHTDTIEESQWTTLHYGLTDKGKKYFGLPITGKFTPIDA